MSSTPAPLTSSHWTADHSQPVLDSTIGDALQGAAEAAPDQVALVYARSGESDRKQFSYCDLLEASELAAAALLERFEPGEHVAVWAPSMPEWLVLMYGAALAGLTLVPINPALRRREMVHVLAQSRSAGIFLIPEYRGNPMRQLVEEIRPQLPLLREVIQLTEWRQFVAGIRADVRLPLVRSDDIAQYSPGRGGHGRGTDWGVPGGCAVGRSLCRRPGAKLVSTE
jgi:fatty-acyl-CoA synthase